MVHDIVPLDADGLFDKSALFERVRVNEGSQECSLPFVVERCRCTRRAVVLSVLQFRFAISLSLDGSFLVAWGKVLVEFSVNQVVSQDSAGTPVLSIGPPLDSRRGFLVNKDIAAANEVLSLSVMGASCCVHKNSSQAGLDDFQRVNGGHDHAAPSGGQHIARGR